MQSPSPSRPGPGLIAEEEGEGDGGRDYFGSKPDDSDDMSRRRSRPTLKPVTTKLSADAFAAPKPLGCRGLLGAAAAALPSISAGALNEKRREAEEVI